MAPTSARIDKTVVSGVFSLFGKLPGHTVVHTGHGDVTTIAAEGGHIA